MKLLALGCLSLAGCWNYCGGYNIINGEVALAVAVDPKTFATLELRGYDTDEPDELAYRESIPMLEIAYFPFEYAMTERGVGSGNTIFVQAWLARDPARPAALLGEPYGKAVAKLQENADIPNFAENVIITIDSIVD